jgi:hypothetical protein
MAIYLDLEKTNTLVNGSDFYTVPGVQVEARLPLA